MGKVFILACYFSFIFAVGQRLNNQKQKGPVAV